MKQGPLTHGVIYVCQHDLQYSNFYEYNLLVHRGSQILAKESIDGKTTKAGINLPHS